MFLITLISTNMRQSCPLYHINESTKPPPRRGIACAHSQTNAHFLWHAKLFLVEPLDGVACCKNLSLNRGDTFSFQINFNKILFSASIDYEHIEVIIIVSVRDKERYAYLNLNSMNSSGTKTMLDTCNTSFELIKSAQVNKGRSSEQSCWSLSR